MKKVFTIPLLPALLFSAIVLLPAGCKKEKEKDAPSAWASLRVNGQPVTLDKWGGGVVTAMSAIPGFYLYGGSITSENPHWVLSISGTLSAALALPATLEHDPSDTDIFISLHHWPNYPSTAGFTIYGGADNTTGTIILTRADRHVGGFIEGSFDLKNMGSSVNGSNEVSTDNVLTGTFKIQIQTVQ